MFLFVLVLLSPGWEKQAPDEPCAVQHTVLTAVCMLASLCCERLHVGRPEQRDCFSLRTCAVVRVSRSGLSESQHLVCLWS